MVKTRLCLITNEYFPRVGGIQKVVYAQNKLLVSKGYEPFVISPRIKTPKRYVWEGTKVECFDSLNIGFQIGIPYAIPSVTSAKSFFRAVKTSDIVHAHGHPYLATLIMGKLAKRDHKPFVLTQHNTFIKYDNLFDNVERLNDIAVGKEALRLADKIIAVSNATRDYVLSLGANPQKLKVIHNGVDLKHFCPLQAKGEETRRKLSIPKAAKVVLTVRRLVYKNGIDTLINAAKIAVKKNPNVVFLVVGKGPNLINAQTAVKQLGLVKNFRFAGFVSDEELPAYYNAADFFVLPSKSGEGLPLVALEAMACGLPVIATNVGGISEILKPECGILIPPNEPVLLAEAILEYSLADLSRCKPLIRVLMEEKHSWQRNVDSVVEIYEELT